MDFEHSLLIGERPAKVLAAFFDPVALATWWQTIRSVTSPQPLGVYAVEWEPTPFRDDILGPLGGIFHALVVDHDPEGEFFLANAYWLPPEGEPIGPMGVEVSCRIEGPVSRLRVRQTGFGEGPRWSRYYEVVIPGWKSSLRALKRFLELDPRTGAKRSQPAPRQASPSGRSRRARESS